MTKEKLRHNRCFHCKRRCSTNNELESNVTIAYPNLALVFLRETRYNQSEIYIHL